MAVLTVYFSLKGETIAPGMKIVNLEKGHVKAGWIYYFKDWNAFALNFRETDIAPYKVYVIGEVSGGIERILDECGQSIEVTIR